MVSRRNFLTLGAASAAVAVGTGAVLRPARALPAITSGGRDYSRATGKERVAVPSACWQCVTRCPNISYVENGRLVKIEGQPASIRTHGVMCAKGQAGPAQSYDPDRILHPMRRIGKRGEGKWKRISWDEALTELTTRMKTLKDSGSPEKFMFHYGRMKASHSKLINTFLATYGTGTIGDHTSICEGAKFTGQELTWGVSGDNWDFDNAAYVLNFGSNVFEAHTNHIPMSHRLIARLAERKLKLVTFDIRLSNTAAKSTEWVPVRPATDRAAILAMCQVIMDEDLYKGDGEAFLAFCKVTPDRNASLADKVTALKAHLAAFTPEWAEGVTGVPAATLRRLAREFATTRPACVISYRGAVAHHHGADTERAVQMLAAITGNIERPGGVCKSVGPKWKAPEGPKDKPEARKLKLMDGLPGAAALATHHVSHQIFQMIKDGKAGRPDIYLWYCYAPVYANGQVQENIDILKDESLLPFTVCINPFYDESAALADMILPDTPYTERWGWEDGPSADQIAEYYIRQPAIAPLGESRDFADVCCDLAERLGFPLGFKNHEEYVRLSCEMTPVVKAAGGFEYMKANGVYHDPAEKPAYYSHRKVVKPEDIQAEGVILDSETGVYWNWKKAGIASEAEAKAAGYAHAKNAFKGYVGQEIAGTVYVGFKPDKLNKSGYLELYSQIMMDKGLPAVPTWTPVPEHVAMKAGELILTTYKVASHNQSRMSNSKYLVELYHDNPAWISVETAAKLGLGEGDAIRVRSEFGEMTTHARITPAIVPGVIAISHHCGHWEYGRYASGRKAPDGRDDDPDLARIWWTSNGAHPNWIIGNKADPISGELRWMDTVVTVEKA